MGPAKTIVSKSSVWFSLIYQKPNTGWRAYRPWILAAVLALLIHLLLLMSQMHWTVPKPENPPHIEVREIDPKTLNQIKDQWKRQLLISKNQTPSDTAPENARFESDRNIRVEKEQRARQTDVLPKPGNVAQPGSQTESKPQSSAQTRPLPKLSDLGLLGQKRVVQPQERPVQIRENARQGQPGTQSADQTILDQNLPLGSENMLNTVESKYYSFYSRLYEAVAPIWQSRIREVPQRKRVPPGDYTTRVNIILDAQGNLLAIEYLKRSGIPEFDQAVEDSWKRINRFPNPPTALLNEKSEVHTGWTFTVQVGEGLQWQSLPPERQY